MYKLWFKRPRANMLCIFYMEKIIHIDEFPEFFLPSSRVHPQQIPHRALVHFSDTYFIYLGLHYKGLVFSPVIGYYSRQKQRQLWKNVIWLVSGVSSICIFFNDILKYFHISEPRYTDFGKLILISKTKARVAMDFFVHCNFWDHVYFFVFTYCDSSDFGQTCNAYFTLKIIHKNEFQGFFLPPSLSSILHPEQIPCRALMHVSDPYFMSLELH